MHKIPVVDLSLASSTAGAENRNQVMAEIAAACAEWGFFQVVNHDVSAELVARVWDEISRFFFNPSYEHNCAPLEVLVQTEGAHYRPINWGEFRQPRTDGDYSEYGKEVQLDEYRLS